MLKSLRDWWWERRKRRVVASLRRELSYWGIDTSDLSDDELEQGVLAASRALVHAGVTTVEVAEAFQRLARSGLTVPQGV